MNEVPGVRGKSKGLGDPQNKEMAAPPKGVPEPPHRDDQADARQSDRDHRASEEFRAECEARFVLGLPFRKRREYLDGVEQKRGKRGREYLERVVLKEFKKRKAPAKGG